MPWCRPALINGFSESIAMQSFILMIHVVATIAIVALVLLQHGKGADAGAAFGTGSAGSLFGSAGAANFLSRSTAVAATVFFCTSLVLTYFGTQKSAGSVMQKATTTQSTPAKDAPAQPSSVPSPSTPASATPAAAPGTSVAPSADAKVETKAPETPKK
jgi:preprotein translocase subunit SecG